MTPPLTLKTPLIIKEEILRINAEWGIGSRLARPFYGVAMVQKLPRKNL